MAENSIKWAAMQDQSDSEWQKAFDVKDEDSVKTQRYLLWKDQWEKWCEWIVQDSQ
jgi:adenosine deaminase CECR1